MTSLTLPKYRHRMILFLHFLGEGEHIFISISVSCSLLGGSKMLVLSLHENEGDVYGCWEVKEVNCTTQYFLSSSTIGELFHIHGKEDNNFKMSMWSIDTMQFQTKSHKLFYRYWQTDSKVYMERWKIQNSKHSIEEQCWRKDTTWLQDF